ncbi:MAG: hypothetical protein HY556_05970 [Euryarchaeota archaeon]|nr:hypothetical protein [Euryarchaeota archaeon]
MAKAAVLIDGGYYEKVRLEFGRPQLDLVAMSEEFAAPAERLRTYYYDALPWVGDPPDPRDLKRRRDKQHYFESLKLLDRLEIRQGRVQRRETKCTHGTSDVSFGQKLVDVKLSVELARLAWSGCP